MCVDKLHLNTQDIQCSLENTLTEECTSDTIQYHTSSVDTSPTSGDDNDIIEFGPIKVKPRKKPAPTLATGRRSKYETLTPEEEHKRELRRARNRAAAERVRLNRLSVEQDLQGQIDALEHQEQNLHMNIQMLETHKLNLQTRISTHEQICSPRNVSNTLTNSLNYPPMSNMLQSTEPVPDFNFDELFPPSSTSVQTQSNHQVNFIPTIVNNDYFEDILMDL
ncbi:unnamed protein product [Adineta ricciae]|uniref:BZIP domain-containing protein n=1 Tax=Adineta ricciae TaxID=249248 RepID=A0A813MUY3_ADIRI|nr:unnamed protein product [Adineta ricciae]CAF0866580.1 unnamed protein product [Adineta ricciae]